MGAVRADCEDVLQEKLFIALTRAGLVPCVLRPKSRELTRAPIEHDRRTLGRRWHQRWKVCRGQNAGVDESDARCPRIHRVVAQSRAPALPELVHTLHVPARLRTAIRAREVLPGDIERQLAVFGAVHIFALELELMLSGIPVRRPFEGAVDDPSARRAR